MSSFDFKIECVPGSENILSDALSQIYAFDAPGTVRARGEYTDHDIVSNDGLARHNVTMPVYVGNEARMAVPPQGLPQRDLENNAITRSQTRPIPIVVAKDTLANGSKLNAGPQKKLQRIARTKAIVIPKRQGNTSRTESKRSVRSPPHQKSEPRQTQPLQRKALIQGAETGRPETG
jgi:hypothetical protein